MLKNLKIDQELKGRVVFASNVRQVLDYVRRGEVEAGIVYATDIVNGEQDVHVVATADPKTHESIEYPAARVLPQNGSIEWYVDEAAAADLVKAVAAT